MEKPARRPTSFRDVINIWPSLEHLADDVGEEYQTIQKWRWRNSIPPHYWARLLKAARRKLTASDLIRIAAASK
jgi:hypothetical protein